MPCLQVESTVAIQALQPRVKEIQEKYKGRDPQEAQACLSYICTQPSHQDHAPPSETAFLLHPSVSAFWCCLLVCTL